LQNPDKSTARVECWNDVSWKFNWIARQTVPNINHTLSEECWPHCTSLYCY